MSFFGEVEKWGQALRDLHKLTPSSALDDAPHPQSMLQQKMGSDHYSSLFLVQLVVSHEQGYLNHCRRYALEH